MLIPQWEQAKENHEPEYFGIHSLSNAFKTMLQQQKKVLLLKLQYKTSEERWVVALELGFLEFLFL